MRISHVTVENFRNFKKLDIDLGEHVVIVGENKIGKSNLIYALRLVLDPSLPDTARQLRMEDLWDGLAGTPTKDHRVTIAVDLTDFEEDENQLAVLAEHLVQPSPMVARLTYVWQPLPGLEGDPKKDADYEFLVYGGDRPENRIGYDVRRRLPMDVMPALRDCEGDLARWSRSPLRPLLDKAAGDTDPAILQGLAVDIDRATQAIAGVDEVKTVADAINGQLLQMVGSPQALETVLRFSPTDTDKLIRSLRMFIDGGKRGVSDASLGSTNLLYFALKLLEYGQLVKSGERDHTFLTIEEPEAHLHPHLQRLVFRNYLRSRSGEGQPPVGTTVVLTTHSPHVVSVAPLRSLVVLRRSRSGRSTKAVSTANLDLSDTDVADLERYLDVMRGELVFARAVILVEGDAERFIVPVFAKKLGFDLDELGITVCSVSGTVFDPYLKLIGPQGLDLPFALLTDLDPVDGSDEALGINRLFNQIMPAILPKEDLAKLKDEKPVEDAGVFLNDSTLEIELFESGHGAAFQKVMIELGDNTAAKQRIIGWVEESGTLDRKRFIKDIDEIGKGRFAQRLAAVIADSPEGQCPPYIKKAIKHVADHIK